LVYFVMDKLLLLVLCFGAGVVLGRVPAFPTDAHKGINAFIFWVSLPAVSLLYIPQLSLNWAMLAPALMAWLVLLGAWAFFALLGRLFGWDKASIGCLVLCAGLSNTSFIGFPYLSYLYADPAALRYAVLCDQPGSFLAVSSLGVALAVSYSSGGSVSWRLIGRRLLSFPPFVAFLLALLLIPLGGTPPLVQATLKPLADTLSPLALFSVGLQIRWQLAAGLGNRLLWGLAYKLLLAPLLIFGVYAKGLAIGGLVLEVSVLEAAMAPMITAVLLAAEYRLQPSLAHMMAGVGIPLSLLTVYGWWWWMGG
jgi:predicted permease